MKKIIILLSIILFSSCSLISKEDNKNREVKKDITTIEKNIILNQNNIKDNSNNDKTNIAIPNSIEKQNILDDNEELISFKNIKNVNLEDLDCSNYSSQIDINLCFDTKFQQINNAYFEKIGKNNCKEIFDSNLYTKENINLVNEFNEACEGIYNGFINNKTTNLDSFSIEDCNSYKNTDDTTYDDKITGLTGYEVCRFKKVFKSEKGCNILNDESEIKKCDDIGKSIKLYENEIKNKRYFELFSK